MPRLRLARRTNSLNHLRVMLVIKTQTEEHQNPPPVLKIEAMAARGRVRHKNGDFSPVPSGDSFRVFIQFPRRWKRGKDPLQLVPVLVRYENRLPAGFLNDTFKRLDLLVMHRKPAFTVVRVHRPACELEKLA